MMDLSAPHLPSYAFFQPVLSGDTESNVKSFEGIPLLSYTLRQWEKTFEFPESEAKQTYYLRESEYQRGEWSRRIIAP